MHSQTHTHTQRLSLYTVDVLHRFVQVPQDRGAETETESFPLVIKNLNINNPEARSCIAHAARMSEPPSSHLLFKLNTL